MLFHRFALVTLAALAPLSLASRAPPAWRALAVVAAVALAAWWRHGFQRRRFPVWAAPLESLALLLLAATQNDPLRALSLFYIGLYFRTLYGRGRAAALLGLSHLAAHFASIPLAHALGTGGAVDLLSSTVLMQIPGFATTVIAMNTLHVTSTRIVRDRRRDVALATLAGALLSAEDTDAVADATRDGVRALLDADDGTHPVVAFAVHDALRIVIAGDALIGRDLDPSAAGPDVAGALRAGITVTLAAEQARRMGLPPAPVAVVPMVSAGVLHGVIAMAPSDHDEGALQAMSSQLALALARVRAAAELHARQARFSSLLANASDVIGVLARNGTVQYQSDGLVRVLGRTPADVVGRHALEFVHPDDIHDVRTVLDHVVAHADAAPEFECRLQHADGAWRHIEMVIRNLLDDEAVRGLVINYRDVTERKELEARLRHQALHDPLTDLANRELFYDRVNHALAQRRRSGGMIGVVYVDLDNFKTVNDTLGHAAGDRLLKAVAMRLRTTTRRADTCARLGGDEFGVLLTGLSGEDAAHEAAGRILGALSDFVDAGGEPVRVDASAGLAVTRGAETADEVIGNADLAMYRAKHAGRGRYEVFEPAMRAVVHDRLVLRADLERGVAAGEFVPYYQPIIDLATRSVSGIEALIRWQHPERGILTPAAFMEIAEQTGVAVDIGDAVLRQVCRDAAQWHNELDVPLRASINMSAAELTDPGLRDRLRAVLATTGMDPRRLMIEIAEHVLTTDVAAVRDALAFLTDLGARIVLDDFGAGDSSLVALERDPVHAIKLAGGFTGRLGRQPRESPLVGAIVSLGQTLGLQVAAQGVTSTAQVTRLHELGCELAQGPYFATPRPADTIPMLLTPGALAERMTRADGREPIDTPSRTAQ